MKYKICGNNRVCFRCLRLDSEISWTDRKNWFESHKANCITDFACTEDKCGTRPMDKQVHMVICKHHRAQNEKRNQLLVDSLPPKKIPQNLTFFFTAIHANTSQPLSTKDPDLSSHDQEAPILMVQSIKVKGGAELLLFFDTGCSSAVISTAAASQLKCRILRPGPSQILVTSAQSYSTPHGDVEIVLDNAGLSNPAKLVGLQLDVVSHPFPLWKTGQAFADLKREADKDPKFKGALPETDSYTGGRPVDIIIGMRYLNLFPELIYSLPNGLSIYKSKFQSADGNYGILAGVHQSWVGAHRNRKEHGHMCFFTNELQAHVQSEIALRFTKLPSYYASDLIKLEKSRRGTIDNGPLPLSEHDLDSDVQVEHNYGVIKEQKDYLELEDLSADVTYRCPTCRKCNKCKDGPANDTASLRSEAEQVAIEQSVSYDPVAQTITATLPFMVDPTAMMKDNYRTAQAVLNQQLRIVEKQPQLRPDILAAHEKWVTRGFSVKLTDLPEDMQRNIENSRLRHFLIWRTIWKETSLTSPSRIVMDASMSTPGGDSLNSCLPTGINNLSLIFNLLVKFRTSKHAFVTDISSAYNQILLDPNYYQYQLYLWKDGLETTNSTHVRVLRTIIYGVKTSGAQLEAGIRNLAMHIANEEPAHLDGARALQNSIYVDDVVHGENTQEQSLKTADSVRHILNKAKIGTKSFTHSGCPPADDVSSDGTSLGVLGYRYLPEPDTIGVDVKPVYFGRPKRGKLPQTVPDHLIEEKLAQSFTKRTVLSKASSLFDPLNHFSPISGRIKVDFHDIIKLDVEWDQKLPPELLSIWVQNIRLIQEVKKIEIPRSVIPPNAVGEKFDLIISCDASSILGAAVAHVRYRNPDNTFGCRLLCSRTKLVRALTIPRGELRACVLGASLAHTLRGILKDKIGNIYFLTDSRIALFWIHSDTRPLHVAVKNSVIEIARLSDLASWRWVATDLNIADLPTRRASLEELQPSSEWFLGKPWMSMPVEQWPTKTYDQLSLSPSEQQASAREIKNLPVQVHTTFLLDDKVQQELKKVYKFSMYLYDPAKRNWNQSVRVMAFVIRAAQRFKMSKVRRATIVPGHAPDRSEIKLALTYYFKKATAEVKHFNPPSLPKADVIELKGILHYSGRILTTHGNDLTAHLHDVNPTTYLRPVILSHSPIAIAVMQHAHLSVKHRSVANTLSVSRQIAYILNGRKVADLIVQTCPYCRRARAQLCKVEMGPVLHDRYTASLPYTICQSDLAGPFLSFNGANKRSPLKIYAALFKCCLTLHVSVYSMDRYDKDSYIAAYQRFSAQHIHPAKIYIDQGSSLMAAFKEMKVTTRQLDCLSAGPSQRGVRFLTAPVGSHYYSGVVERAVKSFKEIFEAVFAGRKMSVLEYETAFSVISAQLNNLPICTTTNHQSWDREDVLTPNRIYKGLNTDSVADAPAVLEKPSQIYQNMVDLQKAFLDQFESLVLAKLIPRPLKWHKTTHQPAVGDLVIFHKRDSALGTQHWSLGEVVEAIPGRDQLVRRVKIRYRNASESTTRYTDRGVRAIAIVYPESELPLLSQVGKAAEEAYALTMYFNLH